MVPNLRLRLLGEFLLLSGETPLTGIDVPRLQSLLAYLILHRTAPQSRSHLAYLLWPDSTESQAHTNLRNVLHKLRQALPDADTFLQAQRQELQWQPHGHWTVDALDFEQALARSEEAERAKNMIAARRALAEAADLYRGDLLPGCYDEWILPERDRLRQQFLKALERLIDLLEQERNYEAAISTAQRLLRHDPLHEAVYRHLMRLYAVSGDRVAALRTYHTCTTVLERELGVAPGYATREVYERLVQADSTSLEKQVSPTALLAAVPLVGRQHEWAQLQSAWRKAVDGQPHLVLLSGEAGIGKTRLAEELQTWVGRQGILTAEARCYAVEGRLAYAPIATWLRTDSLRADLQKLSEVWLTEVTRLLPELLAERPALPRPGPLTESWQHKHLFEALARAVLSDNHPLLLLLDDVQWCDRETIEWLYYLLHFDQHARLLLIGTVRIEETTTGHPL
ncbi:MAG TPA: AAA family ATPase, partial [Ktedonobacteraceae bacterium]|nr:AAA family ATPase [Ktedonobacteraceae bacterium]